MPNPYFQFKQFTVWQGQSSLKVNTDSCLLGAWVAAQGEGSPNGVLDIGTGTGVLALMLSQVLACPIHALEIDQASAEQAAANFEQSPWKARLQCFHADVRTFAGVPYELLICNPPYFSGSLQNPHKPDAAKHQLSLNFEELATCFARLLASEGEGWLILPVHELEKLENAFLKKGLHLQACCLISKYPPATANKVIVKAKWQALSSSGKPKLLFVKNAVDGGYSAAFSQLLKPYYLHL